MRNHSSNTHRDGPEHLVSDQIIFCIYSYLSIPSFQLCIPKYTVQLKPASLIFSVATLLFLPEEEGGDAGHEAAQEAVQQATLPHIISCGIGKAGSAAHPTTTYPHVSTTAAQALLPFCHCHGVDLK